MTRRLTKLARDPAQSAARLVAVATTGQEPENLAQRAQHTVSTNETVFVQMARISDDADERQDPKGNG